MGTLTSSRSWRAAFGAAVMVFGLGASAIARAALFEDDEARRAIIELRGRVEAQRAASERQVEDLRRVIEDNGQMRRSLLDLQNQIEALRGEIDRLTGQNEQLLRDLAEVQRRQKDIAQGVDDRLRKVEPSKVTVDGREFIADPAESRDFEAALAVFRRGDFPAAQAAFADFLKRYPQS